MLMTPRERVNQSVDLPVSHILVDITGKSATTCRFQMCRTEGRRSSATGRRGEF